MTESNVQALLDGVDIEKSTVLEICKNYNQQNPPPTIKDEQFNNHLFFTKSFPAEFCTILEQWYSDGTLDENEQETFRVISECLLKLTKTEDNAKQWLNQQTELINLTEKCANEIGSYGYYIGIGGVEDPSLESFGWLIQAFERVQCHQLLDVLAKCASCRFYIDAFYNLSTTNAGILTITQQFLLIICPNYILTCDLNKTYCLKIVNKMLGQYNEIFSDLLPHIKEWTIPIILCLIYPIQFTLLSVRSLTNEQKKLIYHVILNILLNETELNSTIEQMRSKLVYTSLCLLIEIMRSDKDLANKLKNKSDKKSELIEILNNISKTEKDDNIRLKALALLSLLISEEEFLQDNKTEEVTELFVKNLNQALEEGTQKEVNEVFSGLKDLIQNDAVKQEVVDQNGLPPILKYAKETNDDPLPLEIMYAMTFNADAKKVINQDQEFVEYVRELRTSDRRDVSKMAHGIVWKLEGEEKFKNKEATKKETKETETKTEGETKPEETSNKEEKKYDMMISYCWAQKEICHKINDRLEKDNYKVWLDRDEMHGSIIERMAEAIEQARFIIICMSSNYKNSINCKAEAEYAFSRKSKIVPLIVEPKYRADGWLGFMAGSKIYVDFADKEEEEFDKAYQALIDELKRNGLDNIEEEKTTPSTAAESTPKEPEKEPEEVIEEPEPPPIQTRDYLYVGPASMWNDEHVKEFLIDNQLDQLIPICQSMDGETLIEFHHSCETIPDKIYGIINNPKEEKPVSFATFFKFISRLKKHLPPKPARKLHFQYNFVYPSSTSQASTSEMK